MDDVKGPVHSSDHVGICETPKFGRNKRDNIEFGTKATTKGREKATRTRAGLLGAARRNIFIGKKVPVAEVRSIQPPPNDEELESITEEESGEPYHFKGRTEVTFEEATGKIIIQNAHITTSVHGIEHSEEVGYPSKGVIFASNESEEACGENYTPYGSSYTEDTACGDVYVKGGYSKALTIGAQNNIIIQGSITTSLTRERDCSASSANNFVRVMHRVGYQQRRDPYQPRLHVRHQRHARRARPASTRTTKPNATHPKKGPSWGRSRSTPRCSL